MWHTRAYAAMGITALCCALMCMGCGDDGTEEDPGEKPMDELPEALSVEPDELEELLKRDAVHVLEDLLDDIEAGPADMANRDLAMRLVKEGRVRELSRPMCLYAVVKRAEPDGPGMLWVLALNPRREIDTFILRCWVNDGEPLTFVHHLSLEVKAPSWIDGDAVPVESAPVEHLVEKAMVNASSFSGRVVETTYGTTALKLPRDVRMAVAVRDRSGAISNFIPLRETVYEAE
ncbi:MAG: hypothetical protein ACP5HU_04125 [Phycisphaerae bacterium]